jgi:hypothetical protein
MSTDSQSIVDQVLSLPQGTRDEVLERLIQSLENTESPPPDEQSVVEVAWNAEVARRVEEVRSGQAELLDGDSTLLELRKQFGV